MKQPPIVDHVHVSQPTTSHVHCSLSNRLGLSSSLARCPPSAVSEEATMTQIKAKKGSLTVLTLFVSRMTNLTI